MKKRKVLNTTLDNCGQCPHCKPTNMNGKLDNVCRALKPFVSLRGEPWHNSFPSWCPLPFGKPTKNKTRMITNAESERPKQECASPKAGLWSPEYHSDLIYCTNYLLTVASDLEKHEPGAEYDALRANLRAVATRLRRYVRQSMSERKARASLHCALGEAITRLEGLGYSSGCNEWREIWRATQ